MVEHFIGNEEVTGSNPVVGSIINNFMYEEVKQTKYLKNHKNVERSCLCFTIGELSFEFVYYYDKDNNNLLNIVFNGENPGIFNRQNPDIPGSKNLFDFEFFECELERKDFVIDTKTVFDGVTFNQEETKYEIREPKKDDIYKQDRHSKIGNKNIFLNQLPINDIAIKNSKELGKKLNGKLDHITLHPITKNKLGINQNLQRINLRLSDKSQELKIHSYERNNPTEDQMLWFFLDNSFINPKDTSNEVTGLVLGRNLDAIRTSAQLGGGWNLSNNKISKFKAEELFELSKEDMAIKPEDNFMFLIKKVGIPAFSPKQLKPINFKPKYLYDLKEYAKKNNKKGFIIIGNPEYCCANNQSIFVGFLN